jgi:dimethylamine--corrinoid protein Co-methyltransferase
MEHTIKTRMGDGSLVEMTRSELRAELEAGVEAAVTRGKVPPLTEDELDHLLDIWASSSRFSAVDIGDEVVLSIDGTNAGSFLSSQQDLQVYEQNFCLDIIELAHIEYSFKAVKTIIPNQAQTLRDAQLVLTVPLQYGAMPNLGLYSQPDGPVPNWSELLPLGRIDEARQSQEEAVEYAVKDMVEVGEAMWEAGADGLDFDTSGAAGDGDFLATLKAVERLRAKYPDLGIELGMAGEFVLGMHGQLEYDGVRLAGLWPREQMKVAAKAGATIFGPAVDEAEIPIHMNVGMGVGGVPMAYYGPVDGVSRASRACVEILRLDGL